MTQVAHVLMLWASCSQLVPTGTMTDGFTTYDVNQAAPNYFIAGADCQILTVVRSTLFEHY